MSAFAMPGSISCRLVLLRRVLPLVVLWFLGTSVREAPGQTATNCVACPPGIVAWWTGEETTTDIVSGITGYWTGPPSFTNGVVGKAFVISGPQVRIPHDSRLSFASNATATIEFWAVQLRNETVHLCGKREECGAWNYQMAIVPEDNPVPVGQWVHWAQTWDGTMRRTYTNGVLQVEKLTGFRAENQADLVIGGSGTCGGGPVLIDEFCVYHRTLLPTEIQAIYAAGSEGKCQPPSVLSTTPPNATFHFPTNGDIRAVFSREMNPATITGSTFQLFDRTSNAVPGTVSCEPDGVTAVFTPSQPLREGTAYVAVLRAGIQDLGGNATPVDCTWSFYTAGNPASIYWVGGSGDWSNPANWSENRLPGPGDDVLIDVPGLVVIVTNSVGETIVSTIRCFEDLTVTGGAFRTTSLEMVEGRLLLLGGKIIGGIITNGAGTDFLCRSGVLDGVQLGGEMDVEGSLTVKNGLELNGTARVKGWYAGIAFNGSQTLSGTGTLLYEGDYGATIFLTQSGSELTIGPGVTIRGRGSMGSASFNPWFGPTDVSVVNRGAIIADDAVGQLQISGLFFRNEGVMIATNTGVLALGANSWTNTGVFRAQGGDLLLGGMTDTAAIGTVEGIEGAVRITGTLLNTNRTLVLDDVSGSWTLDSGGKVSGGRIQTAGGARLVSKDGTLDGVRMDGELNVEGLLTVKGGLELNGTARVKGWYAGIAFTGSQNLSGTGTVVHEGDYGSAIFLTQSGSELTIGPGITVRGGGQFGTATFNPFFGPTDVRLINEGTILADDPVSPLQVACASLVNKGVLSAAARGVLRITAEAPVGGSFTVFPGSKIQVDGELTQNSTDAIRILISGSGAADCGMLAVGGVARLKGTLQITLTNSFVPSSLDWFRVLTFGTRVGDFNSKEGLAPGGALVLFPEYGTNSLTLTAWYRPMATNQPAPLTIEEGMDAVFHVAADGTRPLSYQWLFNGTNIALPNVSGAQSDTLTISRAGTTNAGSYSVRIRNAGGEAVSEPAPLTVRASRLDMALSDEFMWRVSPNSAWFAQTNTTHDGQEAAQSGSVADDGESWVETTAIGPGTLTFWWKSSSEEAYDFVNFSTNGSVACDLTGETDWIPEVVEVGEGTNVLRWTYAKDANGSAGQDCAWLDEVVYTPSSTNHLPVTFRFEAENYVVVEGTAKVTVTVKMENGPADAIVNYATRDGSASAVVNAAGDYYQSSGFLSFTNGETSRSITIGIVPDYIYEPAEAFEIALLDPGAGAELGSPSFATVQILDDDATSATNSVLEIRQPATPASFGRLSVSLEPLPAGGRWRFPWDTFWRAPGLVTGLEPGNYEVLFKPSGGYLAPSPRTDQNAVGVLSGQETAITNSYLQYGTETGSLKVVIEPGSLAGIAGWRLQGEADWIPGGDAIRSLPTGDQVIEFKAAGEGWVTPAPVVLTVQAGAETLYTATYLAEAALPPGVVRPAPIQTYASIRDSLFTGRPYAFCGQIRTENAVGSGIAVQDRVVLTAGHLVFDDVHFTYANEIYWSPQRHAGEFEPRGRKARGAIVFAGYSAQRLVENTPGISSVAAQDLDVAALFFFEPAAWSGSSGYVMSDAPANPWLTSTRPKLVVGYPVQGPGVQPGRMHVTEEVLSGLVLVSNRVYATSALLGHPGVSGAPLCIQHENGKYYPAGIYLGTALSQSGQPESRVRAIDGGVVDLINRAATSGDIGTNQSGGVLILTPGIASGTTRTYQKLSVNLQPSAVVQAGAGWRIKEYGGSYKTNANDYVLLLSGTNYTVEFATVPGFVVPTNANLRVMANQDLRLEAVYLSSGAPVIDVHPQTQFALAGRPVELRSAVSSGAGVAAQWFFNDRLLPGATGSVLSLPEAALAHAGRYWVVASNVYGAVTSSPAILVVLAADSTGVWLAGPAGQACRVDVSTNLDMAQPWNASTRVVFPEQPLHIEGPPWTNGAARFYRPVLEP